MKIINLTPHALTIFRSKEDTNPVIIPPSGVVVRVSSKNVHTDTTPEGIPLFCPELGDLEGMPENWNWPKEETILVTSAMALVALSNWLQDNRPPNEEEEQLPVVWATSPGELVRGPDGQPIGCIGLKW